MASGDDFWVAYYFTSRGNAAPTTQLIDLDFSGQRLHDLEDVLDYVFRQGFIEARYRPVTTWARRDGVPVHTCDPVDELLKQGVGKCADNAIKVLIQDAPTTLWFTYHYIHSPNATVSTQRIRLNQGTKFDQLANVTNHVFSQGYLPCHYRPLVHWEAHCGKKLAEDSCVIDTLNNGFGVDECKAIRLMIDAHRFHVHHTHYSCGPHQCQSHYHHHSPSPCTSTRSPSTCPVRHHHHTCSC